MRLTVDVDQLTATARPLRTAADAAGEIHARSADLDADTGAAGHPELTEALGEFVRAWGSGLAGVARHADGLARLLDRAAETYGGAEHHVRGRAARHADSVRGAGTAR